MAQFDPIVNFCRRIDTQSRFPWATQVSTSRYFLELELLLILV
jgi:hypothetical protein